LKYLKQELEPSGIDYATPLTRIEGGFETQIYRFKLRGVEEQLSRPLILRLYPSFRGTNDAVWESVVHNALAEGGYPVPRVYFTCTDMSVLGGAFCIMDFIEGENMLAALLEKFPVMLGETHASLHDIDPGPLVKTFKKKGFEENRYRLSGKINWIRNETEKSFPWLREGVNWILENRPLNRNALPYVMGTFTLSIFWSRMEK